MLAIVPRPEWAAQYANGSGFAPLPAQRLYLHHSVTPAPAVSATFAEDAAAVRLLERIGNSRFGQGISYTFIVLPSGRIFEGHGVGRRGAHTKGQNSTARAICLVGNYDVSQPTGPQLEAVAQLIAHGYLSKWWVASKLTGGHRDAPGASTACPGRYAMSHVGGINARAAAVAGGAATLPAQPVPPVSGLPSNREIQDLLAKAGIYRGAIDGINGPAQKAAVKEWQNRLGLKADGVWGRATDAATNQLFAWLAAVEATKKPVPAPYDPMAAWAAGVAARANQLLPALRGLPNLDGSTPKSLYTVVLQQTLNLLIATGRIKGRAQLVEDGAYGANTIHTVVAYQTGIYGGSKDFPGAAHAHTRWWLVTELAGLTK